MNNYAFIDGQNFHTSVQHIIEPLEALGVDLNLNEFRRYLREKHGVTKAYYFIGYIESNEGLYRRLKQSGFDAIFKEVGRSRDGVKGNVDVNLTLQAVLDINNYQKAVLITSDGDYACLVDYLIDMNKFECLIACSRGKCSSLLKKRHFKMKIYYLDDIIRDLYKRRETS